MRANQDGDRNGEHHQVGGDIEYSCGNEMIVVCCTLWISDWDSPVLLDRSAPDAQEENLSDEVAEDTVAADNLDGEVLAKSGAVIGVVVSDELHTLRMSILCWGFRVDVDSTRQRRRGQRNRTYVNRLYMINKHAFTIHVVAKVNSSSTKVIRLP